RSPPASPHPGRMPARILGRDRIHYYQADRQALEAEAKTFKLPSEAIPQACKYLLFSGLAFFNFRLFAHVVPGFWGRATGAVAIMAEAIALYSSHNFSRSSGFFRWAQAVSYSWPFAWLTGLS